MVLHTVIGEYDILYAQERELAGYTEYEKAPPRAVMSTNPQDYLAETELHCENKQGKRGNYYDYT